MSAPPESIVHEKERKMKIAIECDNTYWLSTIDQEYFEFVWKIVCMRWKSIKGYAGAIPPSVIFPNVVKIDIKQFYAELEAGAVRCYLFDENSFIEGLEHVIPKLEEDGVVEYQGMLFTNAEKGESSLLPHLRHIPNRKQREAYECHQAAQQMSLDHHRTDQGPGPWFVREAPAQQLAADEAAGEMLGDTSDPQS
jgi:hypothetical protein